MNPEYPLYIVSKGRWEKRLTADSLEYMKVPYFIVIEEQEYSKYSSVIDKSKILILDKSYQDKYDTCDDLGCTKSKGPRAARNFVWDHSISLGYDYHWVMDDNIDGFLRLLNNQKIHVSDGTIFKCMEDFVLRYENIVMAGPNYDFFAKQNQKLNPIITNTRIYSCNFIRNNIPFRWRGRYNEDTILSCDILKAGLCTVQFNAFLQCKARTQTVKGGNTAEFYASEGTKPKSEMQVKVHPDISELVFKFGRWHHYVDYTVFKKNKFILRDDAIIKEGIDEYGMKLVDIRDNGHKEDLSLFDEWQLIMSKAND